MNVIQFCDEVRIRCTDALGSFRARESLPNDILAALDAFCANATPVPAPSPIASQVLVRDLKPGDIVPEQFGMERRVVLHMEKGPTGMMNVRLGTLDAPEIAPFVTSWHADAKVKAERPALTLAQLHAEELVTLLGDARAVLEDLSPGTVIAKDAAALLAKVRPMPPVTLEEALDALQKLTNATGTSLQSGALKTAREVLKRVPN